MHDAMTPCPACACHVHPGAGTCPHCGATLAPSDSPSFTSAARVLGLSVMTSFMMACQSLYGVVVPIDTSTMIEDTADADGDGFTPADDCDDENADVYPGAEETPGDGVDSNCDGSDDT